VRGALALKRKEAVMCYELGWSRTLRAAFLKRKEQNVAKTVKTEVEPVPPAKPAATKPPVKERDPVSV
jgi:hypothetical protein